MTDFNQIPFGDLAEFRNGLNFSADQYGSGVKFIGVADFKDYFVPQYDQLGEIVSSDLIKETNLLKDGDILFVRSNGNKNLVGRSMYIKNLKGDVVYSGFCIRARPDQDKINSLYLAYFCKSDAFRQRVASAAGGANIQNLSQPVLARCPIPVPAPDAQKKIVEILSAYDDLIENNQMRIKLLEEKARITYEEWFIRLRFPGHESTSVCSETGSPEGWEKIFLGDLVDTQYGYTESAVEDNTLPKFVRITDFNKASYIYWPNVPNCPIDDKAYEKYKLEIGDIIVARMADPGKVAIIEKDVKAVFASYCIRLRPKDKNRLTPYYFYYTLSSENYQAFVFGASTGATRRSANAKTLTHYYILMPEQKVVENFEKCIFPIRSAINLYLDQNQRLREARDILLPRLMTGVIDVESYDPSQLLKEAA